MPEIKLGSFVGDIEIVASYAGETPIEKIYQGSTLIEEFEPSGPKVDVTDYEYTLESDSVILTAYIGASTDVVVPTPKQSEE